MNGNVVNRIETELNQWRSMEERFTKLLSPNLSLSGTWLKEKLAYYEAIAAKYSSTVNMQERFALSVLRQERIMMEKQLYPNLLTRLLRRLLVVPLAVQNIRRQYNRRAEENYRTLLQQVQRAGFPDLSVSIEAQIKQGAQQFAVPVSYYINSNESLHHQLQFVRDQSGLYQFEGYRATLNNDEAQPNETRHQYFTTRQGYILDTTRAYNLLSGRSILHGGIWMQLDFNDKDTQGNFRVKEFHHSYGYELEKALRQLPLKESLNEGQIAGLLEQLKNGDRVSVVLKGVKDQECYIEANPQFRTINIYDEHFRKITPGSKAKVPTQRKEQEHIKKNGLKLN